MEGEKKGFNCKVNVLLESDIDSAVEGAKVLPIDSDDEDDNYYDMDIVNPIDPEAGDDNQPYSGFLSIWKNTNSTYSIVFFLSYYCGDDFFIDEEIIPFGNDENLKTTIKHMVEKYSNSDMIDRLIEEHIKKRGVQIAIKKTNK